MKDRRPGAPLWAALLATVLLAACGGEGDDAGAGDARPDATSMEDTGFAQPDTGSEPEDAGLHPDAEPVDTGLAPDSGEHEDAGEPEDAGQNEDAAAPDAEPKDAAEHEDAGQHEDAATSDADAADTGAVDAGPPDTGVLVDAGRADGGPVGPCVDGEEGCPCGFGLTCNDPALTCFNASGTGVPPAQRVNVCVRFCQGDADCAASPVDNFLCRAVFGGEQACVTAQRGEGATVDLSRRRGPPMTGCAPGLFAFPNFAGSGLPALEDDQASCGRPCHPSAPVGAPLGCTASFPYCNPNLLTSSTAPGLCGLRAARAGDVCSQSSVVGLCDSTPGPQGATPPAVCVGIPLDLQNPGDPSPVQRSGVCVMTCDLANPSCPFTSDPGVGGGTCRPIRASNTTTGFCSNDCTEFPSRCGGASAFGAGTTCTGSLQFELGFPFSFCRAVVPPVIPEWNFMGPPPVRCLLVPGGPARCQANTYCLNDGSGGLCIRTCDASNPGNSGCAASTVGASICDDTPIGTAFDGLGACWRP